MRVVGNLPYNISTPILFHLLDAVDVVVDQHFMLQKGSGGPHAAAPGSGTMGASVMLQWRYDDIESVPRCAARVLRPTTPGGLGHRAHAALATPAAVNQALLGELVTNAFSQRRKLLRHTLDHWLPGAALQEPLRPATPRRGSARSANTSRWLEAVAAQRTA